MSLLAAILAAWLLAGGAFVGVGLLLARFDRPQAAGVSDGLDAFWFGFGATVALLQVWHLWLPVNATQALGVGLLGCIGLIARLPWSARTPWSARPAWSGRTPWPARTQWSALRRAPRQQVWLATSALVVGAVWLALMGLRPLEIYDAGLYHLQAIAWDSAYPAVPGLGNLHGRLAFNSSFFLVLALFGQGPLAGEAYRATPGLLVLAFCAQVAISIARVVSSDQPGAADWLLTLMAVPTAAVVGAAGLSTTSTDLPVFLLQVLVAYQLLRWLAHLDRRQGAWYLGNAAVLAAAAVTIKLSSAGFVAACFGLALVVQVTRRRTRDQTWRRSAMVALSIAAVLLAGLVANGIVLSGYPLYPSAILPFPVDWRVPESQAHLDAAGIVLFAQQPGPLNANVYAGWGWLADWLASNAADLAPPVAAAVLGVLVTALLIVRGTDRRGDARPEAVPTHGITTQAARRFLPEDSASPEANTNGQPCADLRRSLLLLVPVWVGLAIWFLTAPAYRFAGPLFWLAGAVPVAALQAGGHSRVSAAALALFAVAAVLPPQAEQLSLVVRAPIAALRRGVEPVPVVPMNVFVTDSGLQLNVPISTEQAWGGLLPSTPVPDRRLRLRCADTLACGFVRDG